MARSPKPSGSYWRWKSLKKKKKKMTQKYRVSFSWKRFLGNVTRDTCDRYLRRLPSERPLLETAPPACFNQQNQVFLMKHWDIFQRCLWWQHWIFLRRGHSIFLLCLWWQNQELWAKTWSYPDPKWFLCFNQTRLSSQHCYNMETYNTNNWVVGFTQNELQWQRV